MLTYGSDMSDSQSIPSTATKVVFADTIVSLLAGIAIFPAVLSSDTHYIPSSFVVAAIPFREYAKKLSELLEKPLNLE